MEVVNKDFKVKNGLLVNEGGIFGGPVEVGTPTAPSHAVTKEYIDILIVLAGLNAIDGGSPDTIDWGAQFDGGTV